jgi:hypothetical protein
VSFEVVAELAGSGFTPATFAAALAAHLSGSAFAAAVMAAVPSASGVFGVAAVVPIRPSRVPTVHPITASSGSAAGTSTSSSATKSTSVLLIGVGAAGGFALLAAIAALVGWARLRPSKPVGKDVFLPPFGHVVKATEYFLFNTGTAVGIPACQLSTFNILGRRPVDRTSFLCVSVQHAVAKT